MACTIEKDIISYTKQTKSLLRRVEFRMASGPKIHVSKSPHTGGYLTCRVYMFSLSNRYVMCLFLSRPGQFLCNYLSYTIALPSS